MKKLFALILFSALAFASIFGWNYLKLQKPLNETMNGDPRNQGINISAHYKNYVQPSTLLLNVKSIDTEKSFADVFRAFLQYASHLKEEQFESVILQSQGKNKFMLEGKYFKQLGQEYGDQNPVFTIRTFPENVYTMDNQKAFPERKGGWLIVSMKQMEDFAQFHKRWYAEDIEGLDLSSME